MEEKKSEQYTFAPEEKQILEILNAFERELQEKLQETKGDIERVKFYEKFQMQGIDFKNIFITEERDINGNISYHVYCGDSSNEIISIDNNGKTKIKLELEKYLSGIDLEQAILENEKDKGRLKGISEKTEPEEIKKKLLKKQPDEQQENNREENKETEEVREDLEAKGQDLKISKVRGIKDSHFKERMPEFFEETSENKIAYSDQLNGFVILSKINGEWQVNPSIEPAKTTRKTILSLGEDGEQIEKTVPYALMKTDNSNKEIAVTIDQYGYIDIQTVDVLPCKERLARNVRTDGEGIESEENYETRRNFETEGKNYKHEVAHNANDIIENQQEITGNKDDTDITPDDYIPNTQKKWRTLMDETGENFTELVSRYKREIEAGKDAKKAVETIENDYENISHEKRY